MCLLNFARVNTVILGPIPLSLIARQGIPWTLKLFFATTCANLNRFQYFQPELNGIPYIKMSPVAMRTRPRAFLRITSEILIRKRRQQ